MKENIIKAIDECLMGGCGNILAGYENCKHCGFNKYEDRRRKRLPLIKGEDGLRRRYVGKGETDVTDE